MTESSDPVEPPLVPPSPPTTDPQAGASASATAEAHRQPLWAAPEGLPYADPSLTVPPGAAPPVAPGFRDLEPLVPAPGAPLTGPSPSVTTTPVTAAPPLATDPTAPPTEPVTAAPPVLTTAGATAAAPVVPPAPVPAAPPLATDPTAPPTEPVTAAPPVVATAPPPPAYPPPGSPAPHVAWARRGHYRAAVAHLDTSAAVLLLISAFAIIATGIIGIPSAVLAVMALRDRAADTSSPRRRARLGWIVLAVNAAVGLALIGAVLWWLRSR